MPTDTHGPRGPRGRAAGRRRRHGAGPERRARREAERRAKTAQRRLELLSSAMQAAGTLLDPEMVARFTMERAASLLGAVAWRLYRVDEAAGILRLDARETAEGALAAARHLPLDRGLAGAIARFGGRLVVPAGDPRLDTVAEWPGGAPGQVVGVPLVSRGRVIGIAELAARPGATFDGGALDLLTTLMEPAGIALDNALLFRRLEERTVTDDLTRLYNARFMESALRREAKRAVRYGSPVALLFLDLDGFKQVNDVHGHMAGSRTLVEVGELLRGGARETDVVARWGGDEFALVLPETGEAGAVAMGERIRRSIEERVFLADFGLAVRISVSIGVAAWPAHGGTAESLLSAADGAMYAVKHSGKNGVKVADVRRPGEAAAGTGVLTDEVSAAARSGRNGADGARPGAEEAGAPGEEPGRDPVGAGSRGAV